MEDIFIGRLMSTPVRTVSPDTSVQEAARTLIEHGIGSVVVVDGDNRLEGILTTTDFVRIVADGEVSSETPVTAYMSTDVTTATVNESIRDVADIFIERGSHHLPIVDDAEGVIGMVSTQDLTAYLSTAESPSPS